jgi:antitoxin component YwqK of YwqJK toxin-antitoxin module
MRSVCLALLLATVSCAAPASWWRRGDDGCPPGAKLARQRWSDSEVELWCELPDHRNHGRDVWLDAAGRRTREATFDHGEDHGPWTIWHPGGREAARGEYWHGTRHGRWVAWNEDGIPQAEERYDRGVPDGTWVTYWPNGRRQREEHYRAGRSHGWSTWWDADGGVIWREAYVDGERVRVERFTVVGRAP